MTTPLEALPLDVLRQRGSTKWARYAHDVLPLFVAESDFPLAAPIQDALNRAIAIGDTGYTPPKHALAESFAEFSLRRHGWVVDPARVRTTTDVVTALVEISRALIKPGEAVVITPPVYPPFFDIAHEAGGITVEVPMLDGAAGFTLDLAGLEAAFAAGAKVMLLCNPHNPTGTVHTADTLRALADLAVRYGVSILSDEIHAPLVRPDVEFTPFLGVSDAAAAVGYTVTSASKAFNLAGLKAAQMVTAADATTAVVNGLPLEVEWRTGYFGVLAGVAAYQSESDAWLDGLLARLELNRTFITQQLAARLPLAAHRVPDAGYLAWIDLSAYGWGEDPSVKILNEAKVALNPGPTFGPQGVGHVRLNFATGADILDEAFARIGSLA